MLLVNHLRESRARRQKAVCYTYSDLMQRPRLTVIVITIVVLAIPLALVGAAFLTQQSITHIIRAVWWQYFDFWHRLVVAALAIFAVAVAVILAVVGRPVTISVRRRRLALILIVATATILAVTVGTILAYVAYDAFQTSQIEQGWEGSVRMPCGDREPTESDPCYREPLEPWER